MFDSLGDDRDRYDARKRRELTYLCAKSGVTMPLSLSQAQALSLSTVIDIKAQCRAALRSRWDSSSHAAQTLSNNQPFIHFFAAHPLFLKYQRSDLRVDYKRTYEAIYRQPTPPDAASVGGYTASGMASITAVLMGLRRAANDSDKSVVLRTGADTYFETLRLLRQFFPDVVLSLRRFDEQPHDESASEIRVTWIDTVQVAALESTPIPTAANTDVAVVDTTCLTLTDPSLARFVEQTLTKGVPCILVRSHLKLDCLGMEYGRLGSTVFLATTRGAASVARQFAEIISGYVEAVSLTGLNFDPINLFPLHDDPELHQLTETRARIIRRNTAILADALDGKAGIVVQRYAHGLFLTFDLASAASTGSASLSPAVDIAALARSLADFGLPVRVATSFGLEFLAIDTYINRFSVPTIRLSTPDIDVEEILAIARGIVRFVERSDPSGQKKKTKRKKATHDGIFQQAAL